MQRSQKKCPWQLSEPAIAPPLVFSGVYPRKVKRYHVAAPFLAHRVVVSSSSAVTKLKLSPTYSTNQLSPVTFWWWARPNSLPITTISQKLQLDTDHYTHICKNVFYSASANSERNHSSRLVQCFYTSCDRENIHTSVTSFQNNWNVSFRGILQKMTAATLRILTAVRASFSCLSSSWQPCRSGKEPDF